MKFKYTFTIQELREAILYGKWKESNGSDYYESRCIYIVDKKLEKAEFHIEELEQRIEQLEADLDGFVHGSL